MQLKKPSDKTYKRLSLSQPVGLKYTGYQIRVTKVNKNEDGSIRELIADCQEVGESVKPKGWIQWVSHPIKCEVRIIEKL